MKNILIAIGIPGFCLMVHGKTSAQQVHAIVSPGESVRSAIEAAPEAPDVRDY